jgi:hypothetical protein
MCFAYLLTGTKGMHFEKLLLIHISLLYTPVLCHVECMWKRFPCPVIVCTSVGVCSYVLCLYICDCTCVNWCCFKCRGGGMRYVLECEKSRSGSSRARRSKGRKILHLISLPLYALWIVDSSLQVLFFSQNLFFSFASEYHSLEQYQCVIY